MEIIKLLFLNRLRFYKCLISLRQSGHGQAMLLKKIPTGSCSHPHFSNLVPAAKKACCRFRARFQGFLFVGVNGGFGDKDGFPFFLAELLEFFLLFSENRSGMPFSLLPLKFKKETSETLEINRSNFFFSSGSLFSKNPS